MGEARGSPTQVRGEGGAGAPQPVTCPCPIPQKCWLCLRRPEREPRKQAGGVLGGRERGERLWLATSAPADTPLPGPPGTTSPIPLPADQTRRRGHRTLAFLQPSEKTATFLLRDASSKQRCLALSTQSAREERSSPAACQEGGKGCHVGGGTPAPPPPPAVGHQATC